MAKGLFVTGTGTDVGKTYISALLVKAMRCHGLAAGYYKPVVSGAPSFDGSDAAYVSTAAGLDEEESMLTSYRYSMAAAPHLAAQAEGNSVEKTNILQAWRRICTAYDYITVEGCGGIICPLRADASHCWYAADLLRWLSIPSVIVVPAGLGAINAAALTAFYMTSSRLPVKGFIMNHYAGTALEKDNIRQIERITSLPVWACVGRGDGAIGLTADALLSLYQ